MRTIQAKTVKAAMESVRAVHGDDAVIIHVEEQRGGVRVTIAVDAAPAMPELAREVAPPEPAAALESLPEILRHHGVPAPIAQRLAAHAGNHAHLGLQQALAAALDGMLRFRPLTARVEQRLMLIGQTGQGKTLACARLAAMARRHSRNARIITLDAASAGAMAQLEAFCRPLDITLVGALAVRDAEHALSLPFEGLTLIDTAGFNPFSLDDVACIAALPKRLDAEPVWLFAANNDALDAAETGDIMAAMGVQRFIASRADASRRFASVLTVMARSQLQLAGLSASPWLGDALVPGSASALAGRLLAIGESAMRKDETKVRAA